MNDETVDPNDKRPGNAQPVDQSAAVDRAREALREMHDTPTAVPEAISGAMIGKRYKLLELIGEGGMGIVWMAEQRSPIRRLVAIKLIKAGMDSAAVLARFEAERQALAMMDHQNIARIFDGGTTDRGHPYFVMELVKGLPLTRYCDERRMTVPERLDLFVQVCSAVQHAHQKGIIHRDLKPGNLLVTEHDGKPVPKVIDFGLVKALGGSSVLTEHTMHTSYGAVAGTPHYMAPEQVAINALDIDTRADVYALGVILYELLAGTTPHELKQLNQIAWDEVRRVIREDEPPRPSLRITHSATLANLAATRHTEPARLSKLVAGELDWIVMKALEKDRHRRYGTASDLAADLLRHLTGEPVLAAPPTAAYRLQKIARKYRTVITTAAVILFVLIAGILASTWQAVRASRAETVARSQTAEAEKQQREALKQRTEAQTQRDVAVVANQEAQSEAATIQRQLADSCVQSGFAAWNDQDNSLAALWFAQALERDQGDPHREQIDRIRLNDSFNRCVLPTILQEPVVDETADPRSYGIELGTGQDGFPTVDTVWPSAKTVRISFMAKYVSHQYGIIAVYNNHQAQILNPHTGIAITPIIEMPEFDGYRFFRCSRDHQICAIWSRDQSVQIFHCTTGIPVHLPATVLAGVEEVQFSHNGTIVAIANDASVQLWNTNTSSLLLKAIPFKSPDELVFSGDDNRVLFGNSESWQVLSLPTGVPVTGPINIATAHHENGRRYLLNRDGSKSLQIERTYRSVSPVTLWDVDTQEKIYDAQLPDDDDLCFSAAGDSICNQYASWNTNGPIGHSSEESRLFYGDPSFRRLSPDGKWLVVDGDEELLESWNVSSWKPVSPSIPSGHLSIACGVFSPDSSKFFALTQNRSSPAQDEFNIEIWDPRTCKRLQRSGSFRLNLLNLDSALEISPDGQMLLVKDQRTGSGDGAAEMFSTATLKSIWKIAPNSVPDSFTADGHALVCNGRAIAWDANTGRQIDNPPSSWLKPWALDFFPDGQAYIRWENYAIRIIDRATERPLSPIIKVSFNGFYEMIAPNGEMLLICGDHGTQLWDRASVQPVTAPLDITGNSHPVIDAGSAWILATSADKWFQKIKIEPTPLSIADAKLFAEVVAARRIDDAGGVVAFTQDEFKDRIRSFDELQMKSPPLSGREEETSGTDVSPEFRQSVEARKLSAITIADKTTLAAEWSLTGRREIDRHLYPESMLLLESAAELDPANLAVQNQLTRAFVRQGRFTDVLNICRKSAGQHYHLPEPWNEEGVVGDTIFQEVNARWPRGNDDPTLLEIEKTISLLPQIDNVAVSFYTDLAIAEFKLGRTADARAVLRKAYELGSWDADDSNNGRLLYHARSLIDAPSTRPSDDYASSLSDAAWNLVTKPREASEKYDVALELAHRSVATERSAGNLITLGVVLARTGKYQDALDILNEVNSMDYVQQYYKIYLLEFTAMVDEKLNHHAEALSKLHEVAEIAKDLEALSDDGIRFYLEAAAMIDPATTQPTTAPSSDAESDLNGWARLAIYQFKLGHREIAIKALRKALELGKDVTDDSDNGRLLTAAKSLIDPPSTQPADDFADNLNAAAWAIAVNPDQSPQRYAEAVDLARRAQAAHPSLNALNTLAMAQYRAQDFRGAIDSADRSDAMDMILQDDRTENLIISAMAWQKLGEHQKAKAALAQVLEIAKQPKSLSDEQQQLLNEAAAMIDPASTQPSTQPVTRPTTAP